MDTSPVSIPKAAIILGVSQEAVRKRIKRGTLKADKDDKGHWVVYLLPDTLPVHDDLSSETNVPRQAPSRLVYRRVSRCSNCEQLQSERDTLAIQLEAEREISKKYEGLVGTLETAVTSIGRERDDWKQQAQDTIQAWKNQQTLALPGAMSDMGKLTDGTAPRSLWARLRDVIKPPRE